MVIYKIRIAEVIVMEIAPILLRKIIEKKVNNNYRLIVIEILIRRVFIVVLIIIKIMMNIIMLIIKII